MPISAANRALYPANWKTEIRPRILKRARNRCERCRAPNGKDVFRFRSRNIYMIKSGEMFDATTGAYLRVGRLTDEPSAEGDGFVDIVLTVAHVHDPNPANCADDNLQALCQQCHNRLDQPMRMANARVTRDTKRLAAHVAKGDLFA